MLDDNIMREVLFARFVNEDSYWGRVADAVLEYELRSKYKEPPVDVDDEDECDPFLELRRDPALMDDEMLEYQLRKLDSMALADLLDDIIIDPLVVTTEDLEIDLGLRSPRRTPSEASATSSTRRDNNDDPDPQTSAQTNVAPRKGGCPSNSDLLTAHQSPTSMSSTMTKAADAPASNATASSRGTASRARPSRARAPSRAAGPSRARAPSRAAASSPVKTPSRAKASSAKASSRAKSAPTAKETTKAAAKRTKTRIKTSAKR